MIRPILLLALLLSAITTATYAGPVKKLEHPVPAPVFDLMDVDGNRHKLSDYQGTPVVINFWATWCPPCRREMPSMDRAFDQIKGEGMTILAINVGEDEDTIFTFTADYPVRFPLLMNKSGDVIDDWPVRGLPTTFILDKQGRIVYRAVGGREWDSKELLTLLRTLK